MFRCVPREAQLFAFSGLCVANGFVELSLGKQADGRTADAAAMANGNRQAHWNLRLGSSPTGNTDGWPMWNRCSHMRGTRNRRLHDRALQRSRPGSLRYAPGVGEAPPETLIVAPAPGPLTVFVELQSKGKGRVHRVKVASAERHKWQLKLAADRYRSH